MAWLLLLIIWLILFGLTRLAFRRGRLKSPWHRDVVGLGAGAGGAGLLLAGGRRAKLDAGGRRRSGLVPLPDLSVCGGCPESGSVAALEPGALQRRAAHQHVQAGFLYPPNLLLFLLKPDFPYVALQWLSIGHIWFTGAGMYLLLARGLRVRRIAALTGALAFMFSDAFLTHFGNLNFNAVASWLPWVFWAFQANLRINESANQRISEDVNSLFAIRHSLFAGVAFFSQSRRSPGTSRRRCSS